MLEEAERPRAALQAEEHPADGVPERLRRVFERLPGIIREHLADLDTLLAAQQVDKDKAILAALETVVTLHPCGDRLEAEITGKVERLLTLAASKGQGSEV